MKVLFRVDAGGEIGLGHFFRSINLANKLNEKNHQISFSFRHSEFWTQKIEQGFSYESFELSNQKQEVETLEIIRKNKIDIYYVDGFINFSEGFINEVKKSAKIVFYQNIGSSRHLADIFIIPSIHQNKDFFESFTEKTKIFQGLEYFTFHPFIADIKRKVTVNKKINSVAFAAGGSDPNDTLRKLYSLIKKSTDLDCFFYFGTNYIFKNSWPKALPKNIHLRTFSHQSILQHDVLVNAFGVSTYEFLYLGMPIMSYGHQESTTRASQILCDNTKAFMHIGDIKDVDKAQILQSISVMNNQTVRTEYSQKALNLLDLSGPYRVIKILEEAI